MFDLEGEWREKQTELISNCQYDVLSYEGELADWDEVISVYAVKLNLDEDNAQEVATFDEDKAEELRNIFWVMNSVTTSTWSETKTVTKYVSDGNGGTVAVEEQVTVVYLTVITDSISAEETVDHYGFSSKQDEMLAELLSDENADMWAGLLS